MSNALEPAIEVLATWLPDTSRETLFYFAAGLVGVATLISMVIVRSVVVSCLGGTPKNARKSTRSRRGISNDPHVLMIGTEGSGKTVMSSLMLRGEVPYNDTVTSMEPTRRKGKAGFTLTDYPGSSQAMNASLEDQLASASGILFLIDAAKFCSQAAEARATAALMKRVLTSPVFVERSPPVLVAFNKVDLVVKEASQPGVPLLKNPWLQQQVSALESELNAIKDEMLTSTGDSNSSGGAIQLGSEEDFEFEVDVASAVTFCTCTTTQGMSGCRQLTEFAKQTMAR